MTNCRDQNGRQALLCELHASWLDGDDAWRLESLRDEDDASRALVRGVYVRWLEVNPFITPERFLSSEMREEVGKTRLFEATMPMTGGPLTVRGVTLDGRPRTVGTSDGDVAILIIQRHGADQGRCHGIVYLPEATPPKEEPIVDGIGDHLKWVFQFAIDMILRLPWR
jgi:hypothetical protein